MAKSDEYILLGPSAATGEPENWNLSFAVLENH